METIKFNQYAQTDIDADIQIISRAMSELQVREAVSEFLTKAKTTKVIPGCIGFSVESDKTVKDVFIEFWKEGDQIIVRTCQSGSKEDIKKYSSDQQIAIFQKLDDYINGVQEQIKLEKTYKDRKMCWICRFFEIGWILGVIFMLYLGSLIVLLYRYRASVSSQSVKINLLLAIPFCMVILIQGICAVVYKRIFIGRYRRVLTGNEAIFNGVALILVATLILIGFVVLFLNTD